MPRFVVLHHVLPPGGDRPSHWDLMLEVDGGLLTWAIDEPPDGLTSDAKLVGRRLPVHRLAYLDYEGEISGGRGDVSRWDVGTLDWLVQSPNRLVARLSGKILQGVATLVQSEGDPQRWTVSLSCETSA